MTWDDLIKDFIEVADKLDEHKKYANADEMSNALTKLAQYDDDFGYDDSDRFERSDDYNVLEERELDRDRWLENQEGYMGDARFESEEDALDEIRSLQINKNNIPYVLLRDIDTDDDRNTMYDYMTLDDYDDYGSHLEGYKDIAPMTPEEIELYKSDNTPSPHGSESDWRDWS